MSDDTTEMIRRLHRDLIDSYDEELEIELDDRRDAAPMTDDERIARSAYFRELFRLQGELVKLQDWVVAHGHKMVILFEGRDAAGKGGVIKRITQRLNPRAMCRTCPLPAKWSCLTAAGTTAPVWSGSWGFALTSSTKSSFAPRQSLKRC